jgi:hypothetical protein
MSPSPKSSRIGFHPVNAGRWSDLEELFGERGACGGCWCMFWRLPRKEFDAGKGAGNKRALKKIVKDSNQPGIIAYVGKEPVGWCSVAPREQFIALERSRILKPVDAGCVVNFLSVCKEGLSPPGCVGSFASGRSRVCGKARCESYRGLSGRTFNGEDA